MNAKERKAVRESIAHWKRMIVWASARGMGEEPDREEMYDAIDEDWDGDHCSLCEYASGTGCEICPLQKIDQGCDDACDSGEPPWVKVDQSPTWGEWVANAKVMLKTLEGLK